MEPHERVQWVYGSQNNRELTERYDQWAAEYDQDLDMQFGWNGPHMSAEILERHAPKDARVLDAGAGTGLVGLELHRLGYRNLVAIDMSEGMLDQARAKGVYGELHKMVLGEPLGFPANSFGATICVGVLTLGHAPASSLDELVRVTQPGGYIVFTLRPDIYDLIGAASERGFWTVLGSHGGLLDARVAEKLLKADLKGAGVSLDSLDSRRHDLFRGIPRAWEKTVSALGVMRDKGLPFLIEMTITGKNRGELAAMADFAVEKGATALNVFFLVPTGRGAEPQVWMTVAVAKGTPSEIHRFNSLKISRMIHLRLLYLTQQK